MKNYGLVFYDRVFNRAPKDLTATKQEAQEKMEKLTAEEIHTLERWGDENDPAMFNKDLFSHRHLLKRAAYQLKNK